MKQKEKYSHSVTFKIGNTKKQEKELQRIISSYRKQLIKEIYDLIWNVK